MSASHIESRWEHAHQCQACGHVVRIDDIDAKVIATGIVTCQRCDASGPVNVQIVDAQRIAESMQTSAGKR
jgi:ribosomal protein L37AE/L43A